MKKSLLLVALLGAFGVATAQTSVTMYGVVDAGVAYNHGTNSAGKVISLQSGQQSYSRIGFRGTEDLGSGMKALFVLEQGVQIDTGDSGYQTLGSQIPTTDPFTGNNINSGIFSSQAYVGLSSNVAGQLTLGRQFTPLYEAMDEIDPFKSGFAANINNFFGALGNDSLYQRMDNAVIYKTPDTLWGFKGALAYGFGEQPGSSSQQSQIGVSLGYANGPINVAYAYHHANNDVSGFDATKIHFIGATYDFNVAKLHAAFDQTKVGDNFKTQDYLLGVTVPFGGVHSVFGDWIHKKDKVNDDANSNQFAVGYTYAMSKRTNLYTAYTYVKNNSNGYVDTDFNTPGTSVNTFQVGMRHKF